MLADHHGFQHRQMRKQPDVLEGAGDALERALRRARVVDRLAVERDLAGVGGQHAGDEIEERGFAGAVRADQRVDVAARHIHVEFVQRVEAAETFGQAFDRKTDVAVTRHAWRAFQRGSGSRRNESRVSRPSGRKIIIRIRMTP